MPRKRRKLKDKRVIGLTPAKAHELLYGDPGPAVFSEYERISSGQRRTGESREGERLKEEAAAWVERRRDWKENREALTKTWIAENPGTRPAGWWWFDAPGPRRKASGPGRTVSAPDYAAEVGRPSLTADGCPAFHSGYGFGLGHDEPKFETQHAYLTRRKLWEPGEQKAFKAKKKGATVGAGKD